MDENIYTVYMHTSPCGKRYIGITKQRPERRWNRGKSYKSNIYFTYAINKYGWDAFSHEILFEGLTRLQAMQKEIELIANYQSNNRNYGYNITKGGDPCNKGLSKEEKKQRAYKASRSWIERNRERHLASCRRRDRTDARKSYANALNKTESRRKHRTEYMRQYRKSHTQKIKEINRKSYYKNHPKDLHKKEVFVYDKDMNLLYEFESLKQTASELGYNKNTISNFLRGKTNCLKYEFRYKEAVNDNTG